MFYGFFNGFWVDFIETHVFICGTFVGMTRNWPRMCLGMILVLGISWKVYFEPPNWICWVGILEILEHLSFSLTSEPGNTGKPVGSDTVAVFCYIVLLFFWKSYILGFFGHVQIQEITCSLFFAILCSYFVRQIHICGRDGAAGTGRPGRPDHTWPRPGPYMGLAHMGTMWLMIIYVKLC